MSLFDLCERPGMPSVYVVKQWLFNREYHHEFEGFRELWLQFQENYAMILCDTMSWNIKQLNNIPDDNDRKVKIKEVNKYNTAVLWYLKSLRQLKKLYEAHAQGKDYLIEGVHYDAILKPLPDLPDISEEEYEKKRAEREARMATKYSFSLEEHVLRATNDLRSCYSSDITREEAERLIGMPLLYGRIFKPRKRRRRKYSTLKATTYTVGPCSSYTPTDIPKEQNPEFSLPRFNESNHKNNFPPIAAKQLEAMGTAINISREHPGMLIFTNYIDLHKARLALLAKDEECP